MGHCLFMRKGETHTAPVSYKANFADNTWAQIIDACQKNAVPDAWLVGDQKAMTINGTDYAIDIIGKNHDDYADGSGKAPLTFQMHDCYTETSKMNSSNISTNIGGWVSSLMRTSTIPSILELMPQVVQLGLKEVTKLSSEGNSSTTIVSTSDKLFLIAEIEVIGYITYSANGEGTQYEYYASGNSTVKNCDGVATGWWLRSPRVGDDGRFVAINSSGERIMDGSQKFYGVSFAFCF